MVQIAIFVFFIMIVTMMPKQQKSEKEASSLLIDKFNVPVKKHRNQIKQQLLLEKEFNIENGLSGARKKLLKVMGIGFSISTIIGIIAVFSATSFYSDTITFTFLFISLFGFAVTTIYIYYHQYKVIIVARPDSWKKILTHLDATIDTSSLDVKQWQKPLLEIVQSM